MHERTPSPDQAERLRKLVIPPKSVPEHAVGLSVSPVSAIDRTRSSRIARAIAISSGKGGVGKTNLAVNLAVAFAARGQRVVLLDADLGLANADVLCGITPRATLEDVVSGERTLDEVMVDAPGGFRLIPGASGVSRLADMGQAQRRNVLDQLLALERTTDVLIVDTGAGIGANSMAFAAAAHSILVVSTPEPTAIADAYGAIKTLVAREDEGRAVHARIDRVTRVFLSTSIKYSGSIPLDPALTAAVRRRTPVAVTSPDSPSSRAIRQLARSLAGESTGGDQADQRRQLHHESNHDQRKGFLARLAGLLAAR